MMRLVPFASASFGVDYERSKAFLLPALEFDGETSLETVTDRLERQIAALWTGEKSAAVTSIHRTDTGRACHIWLAGGDMTELLAWVPAVETYAINNQCKSMSIFGRKGWERVLAPQAYNVKTVHMEKKL